MLEAWLNFVIETGQLIYKLMRLLEDSKYGRIAKRILEWIKKWIHQDHGSCKDFLPVDICHAIEKIAQEFSTLEKILYDLFWVFEAHWR